VKYLIIIIAIVILSYFGYRWGKKSIDNLSYDVKFASGFKEVLQGITGNIGTVNVDLFISNKNNFYIPVNGLYAEIYYGGNLIAKSTQPQGKFIIPENGNIAVRHSITVVLGGATYNAIGRIIAKKPTEFTYKLKASAWIVPFGHKGNFTT